MVAYFNPRCWCPFLVCRFLVVMLDIFDCFSQIIVYYSQVHYKQVYLYDLSITFHLKFYPGVVAFGHVEGKNASGGRGDVIINKFGYRK